MWARGSAGSGPACRACAMSSFSSPARSGPNSTAQRSPRPLISRRSSAAARAVRSGLMMWRGRGQVAKTRWQSASALEARRGRPRRHPGSDRRRRRCARRGPAASRRAAPPGAGGTARHWPWRGRRCRCSRPVAGGPARRWGFRPAAGCRSAAALPPRVQASGSTPMGAEREGQRPAGARQPPPLPARPAARAGRPARSASSRDTPVPTASAR